MDYRIYRKNYNKPDTYEVGDILRSKRDSTCLAGSIFTAGKDYTVISKQERLRYPEEPIGDVTTYFVMGDDDRPHLIEHLESCDFELIHCNEFSKYDDTMVEDTSEPTWIRFELNETGQSYGFIGYSDARAPKRKCLRGDVVRSKLNVTCRGSSHLVAGKDYTVISVQGRRLVGTPVLDLMVSCIIAEDGRLLATEYLKSHEFEFYDFESAMDLVQ